MKVSYNILNTFFDGTLPEVEDVAKALMFHSWEIEETISFPSDTVLDVKVLPDKTPWTLSHRGIAKDLSVIIPNLALKNDPFRETPDLLPKADTLTIKLDSMACDRYTAAYVTGLKVGTSPAWLSDALRVIGQRSINNVVDLTNYVMFLIGQPLHAFDARKLSGLQIGVRQAREGEVITTLTGETYTLTTLDTLIVDGGSDTPLGIAGIKGGKHAAIDEVTTDIVLESAHFNAIAIRKTSQRLSLRTDASTRFENGIVSDFAPFGVHMFVALLREHASDFGSPEIVGFGDTGAVTRVQKPVSVSLSKINRVLGVALRREDVVSVIDRFQYQNSWDGDVLTVTPPLERTDLLIPEDLIEEIGRVYGYDHVAAVAPVESTVSEINVSFYYLSRLRHALSDAGFSEIYTSSFREKDEVKLKNAFASDKGYLRSTLIPNMDEALARNMGNADLLGVREIRTFEIGTVFSEEEETLSIVLGVRSPSGYKAKHDDPILEVGKSVVAEVLGSPLLWKTERGMAEASLRAHMQALKNDGVPQSYDPVPPLPEVTFLPFSVYPYITRDVALWVPEGVTAEEVAELIRAQAGDLCVRISLFDTFSKDGRTSYAFRMVFQSMDRTLADTEVEPVMNAIYTRLLSEGFEVR